MTSDNDMNGDGGDGGDFDLDDLKSAMTRATPHPDAVAKAAHLALARTNYEKMQTARQGSATASRLTPERPAQGVIYRPVAGVFSGVKTMLNALSTKGGLTITTAIVACGFIILTPQGQDLLTRVGFGSGQVSELDLIPATPPETPIVGDTDGVLAAPQDDRVDQVVEAPIVIVEQPAVTTAETDDRVDGTVRAELTDETATETEVAPAIVAEIARDQTTDPEPESGLVVTEDATRGYDDDAPVEEAEADRAVTDAPELPGRVADAIQEAPSVDVNPGIVAPSPDVSLEQVQRVAPAAPQDGLAATAPGPTGEATIAIAPAPVPADQDGFALGGAIMVEPAVIDGIFGTETLPNTEAFATEEPSPVIIAADVPVSTFSIDVDTAAYSVIRQSLNSGYLPPSAAVRIEEMINYFPYDYPAPEPNVGLGPDSIAPFLPTITVMDTPWNDGTELVHIGLQGVMPLIEDRPPLNLVFLIDTSGSMADANKLPLLRQSFLLMLDELRPEDEVAIVEYAGSAGIALAPTPASNRAAIAFALMRLGAGGSTNGQGGLEQAYATAAGMTDDGDVSRVILATDGDFNVGLSGIAELEEFISKQRDTGIYLSVLGFGRGNLDDATMQTLAQNGNGVAAYIDTLNEAQKVLVDQLTGALFAIAGDVKVQVEFNPAYVAEYRLIGYETRALEREDFNNDAVDAGELGAGHSVTAIYEITPVGSDAVLNDPLRYAPVAGDSAPEDGTDAATPTEIGFLRLRWKAPGEDESQLIETPILVGTTAAPGTEAQFATAVAGFGQLLRGDDYLGDWDWDDAIALAIASRGEDPYGYRTEAVQLMRLAESLSQN